MFNPNDLRQLVQFAQSAPEFMPFTKACFCVAKLAGVMPEQVIEACVAQELPEIVEAMRVPQFSKVIITARGKDLVF